MKYRKQIKENHQWERRVGYFVWHESHNKRWRAIRRLRREMGKALSRAIRRIKY